MTVITLDTREAQQMLDGIVDRMGEIEAAVEHAADDGARLVTVRVRNLSGRSTGALADSIVAEGDEIGSTLDYARFVFTGEGRGPAQPPEVPADRIAEILAERIAEVLFG